MAISEALWRNYKKNPREEARDALIAHYVYLARYVVDRLRVPASATIDRDDLISHALMGLIEAVDRFDPDRGARFETYAITRIQGAVVDTLRRLDWAPRSVRRMETQLKEAFARLEAIHGRPATDEEVADELSITVEALQAAIADASHLSMYSLDEGVPGGGTSDSGFTLVDVLAGPPDPADLAEDDERKRLLAEAIGRLPERERTVVCLYYYEGLTLKEIGAVLSVTEARVCQIHGKAVLRLAGRLERMRPVFCT